ncbi:nucleotidyltransferase family protein [Clostridium estertheticum]|uniref:nucleotidyltransferase family protein n=1 Tax=Clostridium estertheticum TaxID=238834 RepID=UPI001CF47E95|nr:nucleotidyltransferase family protein [Clostridium estertheticum]MCB2307426.1 nucleotidyltransferase family protein [Clostridium estertheticum]MCB2345683.1 nucleotidyltransferase family protein [Clostridium estertheticum]MCB2350915.1 nucleotidyltransferase family protein [Clostridium estertheticum]WAG44100.1 nucleotidyltransferase family protein [Clostridium estertheticum]
METNGIILVAGLSSRMGEFKPLLKIDGKTMIEHSVDSMLYSGVNQVIVVLGYRGEEIEVLLKSKYDTSRLVFTHNLKYAETDMLASVKIGIASLNKCDAFYLLPGDMPAIDTKTFLEVKETMVKSNAMIVFPTIDGHRKHPPLVSQSCINYILQFQNEGGLREVWKFFENEIKTAPVDDYGCTIDADTKADYHKIVNYMESKSNYKV